MNEQRQQGRAVFQLVVRWYLGAMAFLLPLMFGGPVMATEEPNVPTDVLVWLLLGFTPSAPAWLAPLLSGVALAGVVLAFPVPSWRDRHLALVAVWLAPLLAGLIGLCGTTEADYAHVWLLHFCGVVTFGLAVWWAVAAERRVLWTVCGGVALGALVLVGYGYWQRLGGLQAKLDELKRQHLEQYGKELPGQIEQKMQQLRVNSFFCDPNVFAAHLLVVLPMSLLALWRGLQRGAGNVRQARLGCVVATALTLVVFWWTGSRGGMIGLLAGVALMVWVMPQVQSRKWKWLLPLAALLLILAVCWRAVQTVPEGEISSASVRVGYYQLAGKMFAQAPWTGVGLGEFFPWYVRLKPFEAEMSRDPHSFFASMLSQCGVFGGLAVLLVLSVPLVVVIRRTRFRRLTVEMEVHEDWRDSLLAALPLGGLGGWAVHSFFQFNELIAGTVYLLPVLALCLDGAWLRTADEPAVEADSAAAVARVSGAGRWLLYGLCGGLAIACLAGTLVRLPGEARLQTVSEELVSQAMLQTTIVRGEQRREDVSYARKQYQQRREASCRELKMLMNEMPATPSPARLLCQLLQEELRPQITMDCVQPEKLELLEEAVRALCRRMPHRGGTWNQLLWVLAAKGEGAGEEAERVYAESLLWNPGEGQTYLLRAVGLSGERMYLTAVEGVECKVSLLEGGDKRVEVTVYDERKCTRLNELLSEVQLPGVVFSVRTAGGKS